MITHDIVITDLVKDYGKVRALDHLNLKIPSGAAFGLVGPNGAGKTTLFSLMANFLKPTSGNIEILGHDLANYSNNYGKIGILPQDSLLYRSQSIFAQLYYFAKMLGLSKQQAVQEVEHVLEMVSLVDKKDVKVSALSHGMNKRLGIAQALLGSPQIILLDEPLAGLDPPLAKNIRELIITFKKDKTLIISSHNLNEIEEICDHVAILNKGELKIAEPISEVMGKGNLVTYYLEKEMDLSGLATMPEIVNHKFNPNQLSLDLYYDDQKIQLTELNQKMIDHFRYQNIGLLSISTGHSLEDSILKYLEV